jgi:hypothetical protein
MSSSHELYHRIIGILQSLVEVKNAKQLDNWVWIVVGIVQAKSIALSQIATHIPWEVEAESRVTTIRRWLMSPHIDVWALYRPVLAHVLQDWQAVEAVVILDGVMVFGDRLQIFRLSLRHGGRAIPLAWAVIPSKGLVQVERLETMLRRVAEFLRPRVKQVRFLADRGFRDCDWASLCLKFGWNYNIRVTCNTLVTLSNGKCCRIDALGVPLGQSRYWQHVALTAAAKLDTGLSVTWTKGDKKPKPELLAVISNERAHPKRLREYGWRMSIEQSFRDDQSGGFDMEHTRLQHPERLERLLLALAIATLWCHELGEQVLAEGESARREIDPGPSRELSLFQLGLRWLKRCLSTAIERLSAFKASLSPIKLEPVAQSP